MRSATFQLKAQARRATLNMKTVVTLTLSVLLVLVVVEASYAKEWRGLIPLRSTRADVVRLLDRCAEQKEACSFTLGNERVYILFSGGLTNPHLECARRLPPETIMFIDVELQKTTAKESLRLDRKKFRTFNPAEPVKMGLKGYWNEEDGWLINTLNGKVIQLDYLPTVRDRSWCASFYEEPKLFIKIVPVHFPTVSLVCPVEPVRSGEQLAIRAHADVNAIRGYLWAVSPGKILSGQLTQEIRIDTSGLAGQSLVVTAEFRDVLHLAAVASCTVQIAADR
jgi:hypothetical protein